MKALISSALLAPFELVINQCVAQDIKLRRELPRHSGKVLEIETHAPSLTFFVNFYDGSIRLGLFNEQSPDMTGNYTHNGKISGSAAAMLNMLVADKSRNSLVNPDIQISGDSEFVQAIYELFSDMEIDWQEPLSRIVGDVPTHGLEKVLDSFIGFGRNSARAIKTNIDEYLHEEGRMTPPLNQVEIFDQDLESLKLRLDRLTARKQLFDQRLTDLEASRQDQA